MSSDDIIELNVGGTEFTTTRATLCYVKDSTLEVMFSSRWQNDYLTSSGKIFLDYNPILFTEIIEYFQQCIYQNQFKTSDREHVPSQPTFESLAESEEFETLCDYLGIQQVILFAPPIKDDDVNVAKFSTENTEFDIRDINLPIDNGPNEGNTWLSVAADKGNFVVLKYLLQHKANVDAVDADNRTALWQASYKGHVECLKALIASSADVNKCDRNGWTPAHSAALEGHVECLKALIDSSADVNKCNFRYGYTPTHNAALNGHVECLKALIASSADVNKCNTLYGYTPTYAAALEDNADCIQLLFDAKAIISTPDTNGLTALDVATSHGNDSSVQLLTKLMK